MTTIRTKRIYEEPDPGDGRRVLIDRLWPRGIRKDQVSEWVKDLAPSDELRHDFHDGELGFEEFRARYRIELEGRESEMKELLDSTDGTLTLLYALRNEKENNATVLAEALNDLDH